MGLPGYDTDNDRKECDLLIQDTSVMVSPDQILDHMDILILDGKILSVQPHQAESYPAADRISGKGMLFMPGMIDSHMHTGQQLLKGQVLDAEPVIWTRVMLPFESSLTPEKMRLSAESAAVEMIHNGTTGFVEAGSYFMEEAAAVYLKSGLRAALSCSTMDTEGLPAAIAMNAKEAVSQTDRLYGDWHGKGLLKVYYGLRALNACSDELIRLVGEHGAERETMIQAHMNEYPGEVEAICRRWGMRPYEYLEQAGILSEHFLGAHSLILSAREKELIAGHQAAICHCPFSNCGKAAPETPDLLKRGIVPGFGTDGAAHGGLSLWNEMRIFRSIMQLLFGVPARNSKIMPAELLFTMLYEGGAAAMDERGRIGKLEAGYQADLIGIDLNTASMQPCTHMLHNLLECGSEAAVKDMIVNGKLLMHNREILTLDEERIIYELKHRRR